MAPWAEPRQIEQDLIIARALVQLFSEPFLRRELRIRGGTALNKPPQKRRITLEFMPGPQSADRVLVNPAPPQPLKPSLAIATVATAPAMVTVMPSLAGAALPLPDHAVSVAVTNVAALGVEGSVTANVCAVLVGW